MSWKRRWGIVTALALGQAAIVICYQGFFSGHSAPAHAQSPADTRVVTPKKDEVPTPPPQVTEPPLQMNSAPLIADALPLLPPPAGAKETSAEPPMLPKELATAAPVPVPPAAPVAPLPADAAKGKLSDGSPLNEGGILPVKGVETKGTPASLPDFPAIKTGAPNEKSDMTGPTPSLPVQPDTGRTEFTRVYAQAPTTPPGPPSVTPPVASPPTPNVPGAQPPTPAAPIIAPNSASGIGSIPTPGGNPAPPPALGAVPQPKDLDKPNPAPVKTTEVAAAEGPCPWTLRVEIIKGRTLLTAQTGQEVQFRVSCDKLDLQAPRGNIKASGNVKVESEGLKGACEQLSIAWQQDQVVLEGNAELKSQRDGQDMDLKAAKLSLRLSVPLSPGQPKVTSRVGEVRGATFLSRSKSARGEVRTSRPSSAAPGALQPVPSDGGYDRYLGNEPSRRGSKIDE